MCDQLGLIAGKAVDCAAVADVYPSYADEDRKVADQIVAALDFSGIAIAPAHPPEHASGVKAIAKELAFAKCVIVLWSAQSVQNELVRTEADYARSRDMLVSVVIGEPLLPVKYRDVRVANLTR